MKRKHTWVSDIITFRVTVTEKRSCSRWIAEPRDSNLLDGSSGRSQWDPILGIRTRTMGYVDSNVLHYLNIRH